MDLLNFLRVLARRVWLILAITLIATFATFLITRNTEQVYKSYAKLATGIIDKPVTTTVDAPTWMQMEAIENQFNNILKAMTSRPAVALLSYKLMQHDINENDPFREHAELREQFPKEAIKDAECLYTERYNQIEPLLTTKKSDQVPAEILKKAKYDYMSIMENLKVERDEKTDLISIVFSSEDPFLSSFAVNEFSKEFIRYYQITQNAGTNEKVEEYKALLDNKKIVLDKVRSSLTYAQLSGGLGPEGKSIVEQISSYERKRDEYNRMVPARRMELEQLDKRLSREGTFEQLKSSGDNPKIVDLRNRIAELNARYITTGSTNGALKDSIDILRNRMQLLATTSAGGIGGDKSDALGGMLSKKLDAELELASSEQSVKALNLALEELYEKKRRFTLGSSQVNKYETELTVAEQEYLIALNRYNEAKDAQLRLGKNLRIFELGRPAERPEPSRALLLIAFTAVVSVVLCVVILFLFEYIDLSIRTPSNFVNVTGLPLMGSLNHLNTPSLRLESLFSDKSNNPSLEKFKQLLRKLRFEIVKSGAKTVLFTSPKPGEGKTLILISLAFSLSLNNKKVLLIDTNFKSSTLTGMLQARPILEDWIGGDQNVSEVISRTEFSGIDVIGCAGGDYSPFEILYQDKFAEMLEKLSKKYDYVFLEGSALNEYSDSRELAPFVDKVVAVFSAKSTLKQPDKESIAYLQSLNDQLAGSILNDVDPQNLEL